MRATPFFISLAVCVLWAMQPALAQQPPEQAPGQAPDQAAQPPASGADQVVGLFGATCLHFAGDVAGLRGFMQQQGARQMQEPDRSTFLAGRPGAVYDTSTKDMRLALVSLDDGGCDAVVEHADPQQVPGVLQQAMKENNIVLTPLGNGQDKARAGVWHAAFSATLAGRPMHVLVSTADATPQAVITLVPR